MVAEEDDQKLF